jgi:hypothetical protein
MIRPLKSKEPHLRSFFSSAGDMVPCSSYHKELSLCVQQATKLPSFFTVKKNPETSCKLKNQSCVETFRYFFGKMEREQNLETEEIYLI